MQRDVRRDVHVCGDHKAKSRDEGTLPKGWSLTATEMWANASALPQSMRMPLSHFTYMALSPSSSYRLLAVPPPGLPVGNAIWIRAVLAHSAWRLDTAGRKHSELSEVRVKSQLYKVVKWWYSGSGSGSGDLLTFSQSCMSVPGFLDSQHWI